MQGVLSHRHFSAPATRKSSMSVRIGCEYRTFFGCVVIVPENYAILLHRFKKFKAQL